MAYPVRGTNLCRGSTARRPASTQRADASNRLHLSERHCQVLRNAVAAGLSPSSGFLWLEASEGAAVCSLAPLLILQVACMSISARALRPVSSRILRCMLHACNAHCKAPQMLGRTHKQKPHWRTRKQKPHWRTRAHSQGRRPRLRARRCPAPHTHTLCLAIPPLQPQAAALLAARAARLPAAPPPQGLPAVSPRPRVHTATCALALQMVANAAPLSEAPPTRKPSTSSMPARSPEFLSFTEPPAARAPARSRACSCSEATRAARRSRLRAAGRPSECLA